MKPVSPIPCLNRGVEAHPFFRVEVQILDFSVLEERCEANAVVCQMTLFANDYDVVFPSLRIELH